MMFIKFLKPALAQAEFAEKRLCFHEVPDPNYEPPKVEAKTTGAEAADSTAAESPKPEVPTINLDSPAQVGATLTLKAGKALKACNDKIDALIAKLPDSEETKAQEIASKIMREQEAEALTLIDATKQGIAELRAEQTQKGAFNATLGRLERIFGEEANAKAEAELPRPKDYVGNTPFVQQKFESPMQVNTVLSKYEEEMRDQYVLSLTEYATREYKEEDLPKAQKEIANILLQKEAAARQTLTRVASRELTKQNPNLQTIAEKAIKEISAIYGAKGPGADGNPGIERDGKAIATLDAKFKPKVETPERIVECKNNILKDLQILDPSIQDLKGLTPGKEIKLEGLTFRLDLSDPLSIDPAKEGDWASVDKQYVRLSSDEPGGRRTYVNIAKNGNGVQIEKHIRVDVNAGTNNAKGETITKSGFYSTKKDVEKQIAGDDSEEGDVAETKTDVSAPAAEVAAPPSAEKTEKAKGKGTEFLAAVTDRASLNKWLNEDGNRDRVRKAVLKEEKKGDKTEYTVSFKALGDVLSRKHDVTQEQRAAIQNNLSIGNLFTDEEILRISAVEDGRGGGTDARTGKDFLSTNEPNAKRGLYDRVKNKYVAIYEGAKVTMINEPSTSSQDYLLADKVEEKDKQAFLAERNQSKQETDPAEQKSESALEEQARRAREAREAARAGDGEDGAAADSVEDPSSRGEVEVASKFISSATRENVVFPSPSDQYDQSTFKGESVSRIIDGIIDAQSELKGQIGEQIGIYPKGASYEKSVFTGFIGIDETMSKDEIRMRITGLIANRNLAKTDNAQNPAEAPFLVRAARGISSTVSKVGEAVKATPGALIGKLTAKSQPGIEWNDIGSGLSQCTIPIPETRGINLYIVRPNENIKITWKESKSEKDSGVVKREISIVDTSDSTTIAEYVLTNNNIHRKETANDSKYDIEETGKDQTGTVLSIVPKPS